MSFDVYSHNGELVDSILKLGFDVTPNPKFSRGSVAIITSAVTDFAKQDILEFAELGNRIGAAVIIRAVHYHGGTDFTYDVHFRRADDDFSNLPEYCLAYPTFYRNTTRKLSFDPSSEDSDVAGTLESIVTTFQNAYPQVLVSGSGSLSSDSADIYITVGDDVIHWIYHAGSAPFDEELGMNSSRSDITVNKQHAGAFDPYDAGIDVQMLHLYKEWKKKQHLLDWAFSPPPRGPYRPSSSLKLTFEVDRFDEFKKYVIDCLQESTREGLLRPHSFTVLKEQVEKCEDVGAIKDVITTGLDEEMFFWILNNFLSHPPLTTSLKRSFETNHFLSLREYMVKGIKDVIWDLKANNEPGNVPHNEEFIAAIMASQDAYQLMTAFEKYLDGDMFLYYLNEWLGAASEEGL